MPVEVFANAANTTLSVAITVAGSTSFTVVSSVKFPVVSVAAGTQFRVVIDSELFVVTDSTTTTWTVTPAAEGTTSATHLIAAPVTAIATASGLGSKSPVATVRSLSGAAALVPGDMAIVNAGSGAVPLTIPASPAAGSTVTVKKVDGSTNAVTVTGGVIEGDTSLVLSAALSSATLVFGGGVWRLTAVVGSLTGGTADASLPSAPTGVSAVGGNAQAVISFTASAGATSYTSTSSPGGFTATGAASPLTVTGLTNGTAYTFTVTATNAAGTSSASAASNSVTPSASTVPGAPTIGAATAVTATTATVAFTAPASNGGSAITGYTATSTPGGVATSGTTSPITATGLTASTAYTFTVHATNAIGNSVESAASNSITTPAGGISAPTDISGLVGWYDADALALGNNVLVGSWSDQSTAAHTLTQATAGNKPTVYTSAPAAGTLPNGHAVVFFGLAGAATYLDSATFGDLVATTVFVVCERTTNNATTIFDKAAGGTGRTVGYYASTTTLEVFAGTSLNGVVSAGPDAWGVLTFQSNGAASKVRKDGVAVASGNAGANSFGSLRLGANNAATSSFIGNIANVLVYNRALTATEYGQVEAYLKTRYGTP